MRLIRPFSRQFASLAALSLAGVALALSPTRDVAADPVPSPEDTRQAFDATELERLVAPIALYPDVLLEALLPASTAPLDVVAAARALDGVAEGAEPLAGPPEGETWDDAVVAMLQYPDVVRWMSDHLRWLGEMAFAVSNQQDEVLAAIQAYRARAKAAGVLGTDPHLRVVEQPAPVEATYVATPTIVVIEPVQWDCVYVPAYDPWCLFEPTYVYVPARPFWWSWIRFDFAFGVGFGYGRPWACDEIRWSHARGGGIHRHSDRGWRGGTFATVARVHRDVVRPFSPRSRPFPLRAGASLVVPRSTARSLDGAAVTQRRQRAERTGGVARGPRGSAGTGVQTGSTDAARGDRRLADRLGARGAPRADATPAPTVRRVDPTTPRPDARERSGDGWAGFTGRLGRDGRATEAPTLRPAPRVEAPATTDDSPLRRRLFPRSDGGDAANPRGFTPPSFTPPSVAPSRRDPSASDPTPARPRLFRRDASDDAPRPAPVQRALPTPRAPESTPGAGRIFHRDPPTPAPRAETPRIPTPRIFTPRVEASRSVAPRVETPRAQTPRVERSTRAPEPRRSPLRDRKSLFGN